MAGNRGEESAESDCAKVFVYGTLKPGQIAHDGIEHLVDSQVPGELLKYDLVERDGLPFARIHQSDGSDSGRDTPLVGWLLHGSKALTDAIERYEPEGLYKKEDVEVNTRDGRVRAWAFVQRGATRQRARLIPNGSWEAHHDPVFASGFPFLFQSATDLDRPQHYSDEHGYWEEFWTLQGLFLNLSTVVERFAKLLYGGVPRRGRDGKERVGPTSRIALLDEDETIREAIEPALDVAPEVRVFKANSRDNSEHSTKGAKPFQAWYQVRSNVVHQGKIPGDIPSRDTQVLKDSTDGLSKALALALSLKIPELDREWEGSRDSQSLVHWIRGSRRVDPSEME